VGLFRWKFTRKYKLAAVERLEASVSVAEVERGSGGQPEFAAALTAGISHSAAELEPCRWNVGAL
jgi:hypothetical protein